MSSLLSTAVALLLQLLLLLLLTAAAAHCRRWRSLPLLLHATAAAALPRLLQGRWRVLRLECGRNAGEGWWELFLSWLPCTTRGLESARMAACGATLSAVMLQRALLSGSLCGTN
jgi:hypothetical protein